MNLKIDLTTNLDLDQSKARSSLYTQIKIPIKQLVWEKIRSVANFCL